ncbi:putative polyketide hydroxylase [Kitasatospora sp. MAA4]|uniref:FAD-dependent monooxygenase n=1 Tax=Kitasatospora sp. MAA4 TaxID=3035093 RepID=UPI00247623F9|nr:FAD-dependent monooxygenase [Kitasatospora sp. MAA4]MDH6132135.1 putative polyketide hydroxylase [Kitasatospora sp. MAA4]
MRFPTTTRVLIAGGGPVGLTLSVLLSAYGVDHLLVEARPDTARHPKARGLSTRSMEVFRRCGLEDVIRAAGLPADHVFFYRGRSLVDPDFVRTGIGAPPQDGAEHSPSPGLICSQDVLEPLLLRRAREAAADRIRFGTRLRSFTQDGDGVHAVLADPATGEQQTVCADWLVGCDGAASGVRSGAGLALAGPTGLGHFLSVRFDAPLGAVVADRASAAYFLTGPGGGGFLAVDNDRQWIYQRPFDPAQPDERLTDPSHLADLVRGAAGLPELPVTVRDTTTWRMDAQVADAYRSGRVLLAGDAAHVVPPTGGHGMNTGIGDADNLAWKLAAVASGRAGTDLLDSYQAERRPVARQIIDRSTDNSRARTSYRIDDELLLSAVYRSGAVACEDAAGPPQALSGYRPSGSPGARAPHVRLTGRPGIASTLDLVGPGFTLLTPARDASWQQQADAVGAAGLSVTVHPLDDGQLREEHPGRWARICAVPPGGALLVRPDGHIAWRTERPGTAGELGRVLRRVLALAS